MLTNRIKRVTVKNYRSLGDVTVELDDLTVLVGPNGSGKSNFLDVLRFVSDSLRYGLDTALVDRGGIERTRRYSSHGRPYNVTVRIDVELNGRRGFYKFVLGSTKQVGFTVKSESCDLGEDGFESQPEKEVSYIIREGTRHRLKNVVRRSLLLPFVAGDSPALELVYDFLTQMRFYSIFPNDLREPQFQSPEPLDEHGENLATILRQLAENPWRDDLSQTLAQIVPGVSADNPLTVQQLGTYLLININYEDGSVFDLKQESDGTLRVLGLLAAAYQKQTLPLIGIEEPELFVHPHALSVLADVFEETSHRSQVILTTHSPDLISRFPASSLRLVERVEGVTQIGRIRDDQISVINDQLFKGGDLLRIGGLSRE